MDKNENNLHESTEESSAGTYCKEITPILSRNAVDQSIISKITEELKIKRLTMELAEMDAKIATIQKRIARDEKQGAELDRQLHNATEMEGQSMRCFKRTDKMFTVLVDECDKLKNEYKNLEGRQLEFTTKVEELILKNQTMRDMQQEIENLEQQIKEILNAPKPSLDENLVQENLQLRIKYQKQVQEIANKRLKQSQLAELTHRKCKLLQEICMAQTRNKELQEKVTAKKQVSEKNRNMLQAKFAQIQDKIASNVSTRNELLNGIKESEERVEDITSKIFSKKSQHLLMVQEKKLELAELLSSKQSELANEQLKRAEEQDQLKSLNEKMEAETQEVDEWQTKKQALDNQLQFLKNQLTDLSTSLENRLAKADADSREKKDLLLKQHSLEAGKIEFLELQRNENLNKVKDTQKDLKKQETLLKWEHMQYQFVQNDAAKLGIDTSTIINSQKTNKYTTNINQENMKVEVTEIEEDELTSGQKSPGILKSPGRAIFQKTDKHVSFEGLSSTESSTSGVATKDGRAVNPDLNEDEFDKLIDEWAITMPSTKRRKHFDF
ncbi:uncharacterized protein MCAP_0864-like [Dendroctonus ponderosae]|uniref:uncharacterized protein MCAP_0864-like n=1 Tax=Dendroctonus ponderosae TaxID=77166 RepID=UPI0020365CE1|nr:uncharacterized protein MCAP_0864-like [Dendroctonus ponderosae]KAH1013130.1 hypothetical protein HUJ05_012167 [Dendroctonus ponderosae]